MNPPTALIPLESNRSGISDNGAIRIYDSRISVQEISKTFALQDVEVLSLGRKAETLEDYFLKITSEVSESC